MNHIQVHNTLGATKYLPHAIVSKKTSPGSRIHVLHPEARTCEAIALNLKLEGFAVGFSFDWADCQREVERSAPHVLIAPLALEGADILEIIRIGLPRGTFSAVITVAENPSTREVVAAMKAGAFDVLTLPIDPEGLLTSVRAAMARTTIAVPNGPPGLPTLRLLGLAALSPKEREVLPFLIDGLSSKGIGNALSLSPRTIEVHRANILRKMGAKNTADLMRKLFVS